MSHRAPVPLVRRRDDVDVGAIVASRSHIITRRSARGNGSGASSSAWTTLKMAVFAPMPSASVKTATAVKPGERREAARHGRVAREHARQPAPCPAGGGCGQPRCGPQASLRAAAHERRNVGQLSSTAARLSSPNGRQPSVRDLFDVLAHLVNDLVVDARLLRRRPSA